MASVKRGWVYLAPLCGMLWSQAGVAETLKESVSQCLVTHPALKADVEILASARDNVSVARSDWWPVFGALGEVNLDRYQRQAGPLDLQGREYGVRLSQLIYDGWSMFARVRAVDGERQALRLDRDRNGNTIALASARAHLGVMRERELLQAAQSNVDAHREAEARLVSIVKYDPGRQFDLDQIRTRVVFAESLREERAMGLMRALAGYRELVGKEPGKLPEEARKTIAGIFNQLGNLDAALVMAEKEHPAILGALARVASAQSALEAAEGGLWPRVTANARYNSGVDRQGVPGRNDVTYAGVLASYTYGSPNFKQVELAQARLSVAQKRVPAITRDIREALRVAWAQLEGIRAARGSAELAATQAAVVLEGFKTQYLFGRRTALELLIVQNDSYRALARAVGLRYDELIAQLNVLGQMGVLEKRLLGLPKLDDDVLEGRQGQ